MMKALLRVRFRALFRTMFRRSNGKKGTGTAILLGCLLAYAGIVFLMMYAFMFQKLALPYHLAGLDWLYFATAGLMALGLSVFGSVFITQNQLYEARDNELLLSMPVKPGQILLSRMLPLLAFTALFSTMVLAPALVVYGLEVGYTTPALIMAFVSLMEVPLLAQALCCALGWVLHQGLRRMNKTLASTIYMVLFLVIYFYVYTQANSILNSMASNGAVLAETLRSWAWPLYAMGMGCMGSTPHFMAFLVITLGIFSLVYWFLSATFLRSAFLQRGGRRRGKARLDNLGVRSAAKALHHRESRRFLSCPTYFTNMGLGIALLPALAIAGIVFRADVLWFFDLIPGLWQAAPLLVMAALGFLITTACVSTPSVSLEGNTLWVLKALPLTAKQILRSKLRFHWVLVVPVSALSGLALSLGLDFSPVDAVLCTLCPALLAVLMGIVGMLCGLQWAKFDWQNEAYPCKQSAALLISMFGMEGLLIVLGLLYGFGLSSLMSPTVFLAVCCLLLAGACALLYRLLMTWGVRKWNSF